MTTKRLVLIFLCLILCWMLPVGSVKISNDSRILQPFPLDMSENSIDDMYSDCSEKMKQEVEKVYFKKEINNRINEFKKVWEYAKTCANRAQPVDKELTKNHLQAICAYTAGTQKLYKIFNDAVRSQRTGYGSTFQYHFLHFWLTRAVQILSNDQTCHETYRRTTVKFDGRVKDEIRFGTFTSTSKLSNLTSFGDVTCFKTKTCSGAYLKEYPERQNEEQEVLIPPYEKFRITKKCETESCKPADLMDCKTIYVLVSTGIRSDLDCKLAK